MDYFICGEKFLDFYFFKSIFLLARTPLCNLKLFDINTFFYVNEFFDFSFLRSKLKVIDLLLNFTFCRSQKMRRNTLMDPYIPVHFTKNDKKFDANFKPVSNAGSVLE